jgi:hypothetical protein
MAEIFGEQGVSNAASARQAEDRRLRLARANSEVEHPNLL